MSPIRWAAIKEKSRGRKNEYAFPVHGMNDETALSPEGNRTGKKWQHRAVLYEERVMRRWRCE
jgi:hypothetical protein